MGKKGNISLEGYRKNSPDRFNDFNIIPSNEISMQNVNKNVLMIPMGGRGTGNPILAKPGERYFFPNHDFVFEQAMPENAMMRYQRVAKHGGLHKAEDGYEMASKRLMNSFMPENSNVFRKSSPLQFPSVQNLPYYPSNNQPSWQDMIAAWQEQERRQLDPGFDVYRNLPYNVDPGFDVYPKRTGPGPIRMPNHPGGFYVPKGTPYPLGPNRGSANLSDLGISPPKTGETHSQWSTRNGIPGGGFNGAALANQVWTGQEWEDSNYTVNKFGGPLKKFQGDVDGSQVSYLNTPVYKDLNDYYERNKNATTYVDKKLTKLYPNVPFTDGDNYLEYAFQRDNPKLNCVGEQCTARANRPIAASFLQDGSSWFQNPDVTKKDLGADYSVSRKPTEEELKKYPYMSGDVEFGSLDAWDILDQAIQKMPKNVIYSNLKRVKDYDNNYDKAFQDYDKTAERVDDIWKKYDIPVGSYINLGSSSNPIDSPGHGREDLVAGSHTVRVVGYAEDGEPLIADYGQIRKLSNNTIGYDKVAGIVSVPGKEKYTYKYFKDQQALEKKASKDPYIKDIKSEKYGEDYKNFHNNIVKEKNYIAAQLGVSPEKYDQYAKIALTLGGVETEFGKGTTYNIPLLDKLGESTGVAQVNESNVADKYKKTLDKYKDNPEAYNAMATLLYVKELDAYKDKWMKSGKKGSERPYVRTDEQTLKNIVRGAQGRDQQGYISSDFGRDVFRYTDVNNKPKEITLPFKSPTQSDADYEKEVNALLKQTDPTLRFSSKGPKGERTIYKKTSGNTIPENLEDFVYYAWQAPNAVAYGDAQGDSGYYKKAKNIEKSLFDKKLAMKKFGGDLPKAQMYNSQVNRPMPNFDPRVMGPAMRQQQIAAHNRAVAEMSTPDVLQEYTPQKFSSKGEDVITNPFTAITNMYQHGYLPDNFTQGQRNYLDYAQDYINPASLGKAMYNAATNVFDPEMYKDIARSGFSGILGLAGEEIPQSYMDANMRNLQRLGDFASAVPGIKSASPYVKKAIETAQKQLSKGAKVAAKVADKKIIKPLQELTQTTKPIQNFTQLNNVKTSNTFNDINSFSKYFQKNFGSEDNLLRSLQEKGFDTRIIDHVFNHGTDAERIKLANHLYDVLQGSKIDRALVKADEFIGKKLVKGAQAPELKQVVEKANEKLAKGLGVKKGELPIKLRANEANNTVSVKVGDNFTGFVELSPVSQSSPRFSEILKGKKPSFVKDYADALNFRNAQFPGLAKSADFPFTGASEDFGKQLMGQGYSGEINKAISEALKDRGARLYSGATGHTDFGRQRYQNLLSKGLVEDISPKIPGSHNLVIPGNEIYMYKKKGGALPNRRETNKNIKSSINNLMRRNETLFGPAGRNFYNPNPMSKYYKGGIAFPQAPTAGSTKGQQESEFYAPNWIPPGPVGFYEHGGIAYPQQPTNDYFFSGSPWMPHYDMGGGLPGGANNMYMPCMNCGGYMEDGGMYYADMGINMTSNYGTNPVTDKEMTPQQWDAYNKGMGYTEIPGSSTYKKYYNSKEYTPDENFTFTKVGDVGKNVDYSNDPSYKPLIEYGYKEEQKPIQTKQSRVIPELSNRREIDNNQYFKTYRGPDNKLSYYDMQSNQAIDPTKSFEGGKYKASFLNSPVIAKQRYGGFQEGGFMSPDNMMDYPTFSQGGDPYGYADGGINNPGFRALPQSVQQNIISNMQDGGNVLGLDQDQITRTLGQNFMSGVQGNMSPNLMREAVTQYVQNPFDMPQGEYGYNMNTPNMTNANNMYAAQQRMNELANKNSRIGSDIYNTGMFALGTANEYTKYKAKKAGKGTLPGNSNMTANPDIASNKGLNDVTTQSVQPDMTGADMTQTGMARYGAAYIPKADVGKIMPEFKLSSIRDKSPSVSASTATNTSNLDPEITAAAKSIKDDMAADTKKWELINQMQQAGNPYMMGSYPNMMGQQGQFAPNFQGMYDMFGNDDYRVGRMSRGMRNMLPYMMFNPQNTYLQEFNAKKALFGPGARKVSMKFRTVFDPRTGQQVQVPVEGKEVAKDSKSKMTNQEGRSAQKDYEDMNLFERMRANRQAKRMMREDERRFKGAKGSSNEEEDFIKQAMEEEARREEKWGVQKAIPNDTKQTFTQMSNLSTGPVDQNKLITESIAKSMAERKALRDPLAHSDETEQSPYDFQKRVFSENMFGDYRPQYDYNFGPAGISGLDQDWNAISRTQPGFQQDAMIDQYMQNQSRMATAPSYSPNSARGFSQEFYGLPTGSMTPDLPSSNRTAYSLDPQGKPVRNTMQSLMQSQLQPQKYGGMYEEGGIHELSEDEINQILAAGGSVTYID